MHGDPLPGCRLPDSGYVGKQTPQFAQPHVARGQTIRATGNSFATPHIAGLIAKILGKHPNLTPIQMKTVLQALAQNVRAG